MARIRAHDDPRAAQEPPRPHRAGRRWPPSKGSRRRASAVPPPVRSARRRLVAEPRPPASAARSLARPRDAAPRQPVSAALNWAPPHCVLPTKKCAPACPWRAHGVDGLQSAGRAAGRRAQWAAAARVSLGEALRRSRLARAAAGHFAGTGRRLDPLLVFLREPSINMPLVIAGASRCWAVRRAASSPASTAIRCWRCWSACCCLGISLAARRSEGDPRGSAHRSKDAAWALRPLADLRYGVPQPARARSSAWRSCSDRRRRRVALWREPRALVQRHRDASGQFGQRARRPRSQAIR